MFTAVPTSAAADDPPLSNGSVWVGTISVNELNESTWTGQGGSTFQAQYAIGVGTAVQGSSHTFHGSLQSATMSYSEHRNDTVCDETSSWAANSVVSLNSGGNAGDFPVDIIVFDGDFQQSEADGSITDFPNGGLQVSDIGIQGTGHTVTDSNPNPPCGGHTESDGAALNTNTHNGAQGPSADGTHYAGSRTWEYTTGDATGTNHVRWVVTWDLTVSPDADFDGVADSADNCPTSYNPDQLDTDHDGMGNVCDPDSDNDGVPDATDNCPTNANSDQADLDKDHVGDVCDPDIDGDGQPNATDPCPTDATNTCDNPDGDNIPSPPDNCPTVYNPDQLNFDHDTLGDACDPDVDGDGVSNAVDKCAFTPLNTPVTADGCPKKKSKFELQIAGLYAGTIDGGDATVIGGDSALMFADPSLLPQMGRLCIFSDFKVTVQVDTPTSIPILWNGQPRPFTDDPSMYNWIILGHGKESGAGFFTKTYWEEVRIELCGSPAEIHQGLTINIASVAGPVLSIEHTATAQVYALNGTLLGDVKDDASGKSAAFKLSVAKARIVQFP